MSETEEQELYPIEEIDSRAIASEIQRRLKDPCSASQVSDRENMQLDLCAIGLVQFPKIDTIVANQKLDFIRENWEKITLEKLEQAIK